MKCKCYIINWLQLTISGTIVHVRGHCQASHLPLQHACHILLLLIFLFTITTAPFIGVPSTASFWYDPVSTYDMII